MTPAIEYHPFEPFLPPEAKVLMLGTFPPQPVRWAMEFYYPNPTNDMWRIQGLLFYGDKNHFWRESERRFDLDALQRFLTERGIALYDTARAVRRLKNNASDKFLEIVETVDLERLLDLRPTITEVVTAGEKATGVVAQLAGVDSPKNGTSKLCQVGRHTFTLWRMPSSSRAYPLALERKADFYRQPFSHAGIL